MSESYEDSKDRRSFLRQSLRTLIGLTYSSPFFKAIAPSLPALTFTSQSQSTVHNMLILGTKAIYLYHLPMFSFPGFDSPRRYQMILEITLTDQEAYSTHRALHKEQKIYTFSSERVVLTQLKAGSAFKGTIFRGHFEKKGAQAISEGVTANVKRVLYSQELKWTEKRSSKLEYFLFGRGREFFMAHLITGPPDFDQILAVRIFDDMLQKAPDEERLDDGIRVTFPQITNSVSRRIKSNARVIGTLPKIIRFRPLPDRALPIEESGSIEMLAESEIFFEEGELRTPPEFATTLAEKEAGFP